MRRRSFLQAGACLIPFAAGIGAESGSETGFYRLWWYQPGVEHGNPVSNNRFRVNAPEAVIHPTFFTRSEVKSSGMLQILVEENLLEIAGASLYLELWGGHPGTVNKRVTPNGRTTYPIQEVGTAAKHCTHEYPEIPLKVTDLVNGYNAFQFACDQGTTFWGHFIVENACVRVQLPAKNEALQKAGLAGFSAKVSAVTARSGEAFDLGLEASHPAEIAAVEYQAFYDGYDENGNGEGRDWHGFTTNKRPVAYAGTSTTAPWRATWDVSMIPDQSDMAARARIRFRNHPNFEYVTPARQGLATPRREGVRVELVKAAEVPAPFWSRANRKITCELALDVDPSRIERAELHTISWDGGAGGVKEYFTMNGKHFPIAATGRHDVIYTVLPVESKTLRKGSNRFELLSDTDHHGIEILLPGPQLMIRRRS